MRELRSAQRLIVAADFKPISGIRYDRSYVRSKILDLCKSLCDTEVIIKVNSALRACGYDLTDEIHSYGLEVFADLKLYDIGETLSGDGLLLKEGRAPELLTVAPCGVKAMKALKAELPRTEVLGVTALTTFTDEDSMAMFACSTEQAVLKLARMGKEAEIDGLISSAKEAGMLRGEFKTLMSINTPAIRPSWAIVPGDDQNPERIMTPYKAIKAGADRIVVGRPITQAESPYDAVMRTIGEIELALN